MIREDHGERGYNLRRRVMRATLEDFLTANSNLMWHFSYKVHMTPHINSHEVTRHVRETGIVRNERTGRRGFLQGRDRGSGASSSGLTRERGRSRTPGAVGR